MKRIDYTLTFHTPAFLGNAEQSGQWRTPPFKAQLRQWWRMAYAAAHGFPTDFTAMRREEGLLFGHAWLEDDEVAARRSKVRIRLGNWNHGKLTQWQEPGKVVHPEVGSEVGAGLYLGYGPLVFKSGTQLKSNAAIQAGDNTQFSLACPEALFPLVEQALALMDRFGAVGGRSRNGWGSFSLAPSGQHMAPAAKPGARPWQDALELDWPHAVGSDAKGGLVWQTSPFGDWKALMKALAAIKIGLRTQFKFPQQRSDGLVHGRHWLSYPVTNHFVSDWGKNARLPNSLRFKVRPAADGKLVGVIVHIPCRPPAAFSPDPRAIEAVWQKVHAFLDQKLARVPA